MDEPDRSKRSVVGTGIKGSANILLPLRFRYPLSENFPFVVEFVPHVSL